MSDESEDIIAILVAGLRAEGLEPEDAHRHAQGLYVKLKRDYERAGRPYSDGHGSMMLWLMRNQPIDLQVSK
jgi:hypothetical protein